MSYLQSRGGLAITCAFFLCSGLVVLFPSFDIAVSRLFFNGIAFPADAWWTKLQQTGLLCFLGFAMAAVVSLYAWNRLRRRRVMGIDGRKLLYLVLVLVIGAGLIVNVAFKNHFGRARPRDIAEFGGYRQFVPAFVVSDQCRSNCSFSSGDSAAGFFAIALAMALRRRRAWYGAAVAFGILISIARLASGAHFFSDTMVSFFVMLIVADVLYHYMLARPEAGSSVVFTDAQARPASTSVPRDRESCGSWRR